MADGVVDDTPIPGKSRLIAPNSVLTFTIGVGRRTEGKADVFGRRGESEEQDIELPPVGKRQDTTIPGVGRT